MAGWIRTVGSVNSVRNRPISWYLLSPEGTTARGGSSRSFRNPAKSCGVRRDSVHRWITGSLAEPRALDAEATSRLHGVRRQVAVATNNSVTKSGIAINAMRSRMEEPLAPGARPSDVTRAG